VPVVVLLPTANEAWPYKKKNYAWQLGSTFERRDMVNGTRPVAGRERDHMDQCQLSSHSHSHSKERRGSEHQSIDDLLERLIM